MSSLTSFICGISVDESPKYCEEIVLLYKCQWYFKLGQALFARFSFILLFATAVDEEKIRKEVTEQYTVKIQEYELKLSNADTKVEGNES